ncbi:MAG TPA: hypothetical protein VKY89_22065 [Thermoanaerobaculia bacterium]|nr:hypothetical protein [Thermoanaerobaculia bacterium]
MGSASLLCGGVAPAAPAAPAGFWGATPLAGADSWLVAVRRVTGEGAWEQEVAAPAVAASAKPAASGATLPRKPCLIARSG